jgi:hypothetical protein
MFASLLAGREVDAVTQEQAYAYALRHKSTDVLVLLANVRNLTPELDAALSEQESVAVLREWANRPGRTTEELLERFAKERRASLLLGLAETPDLPQALYRDLAQRKAPTLNWAMLENPTPDESLKVELATMLGSGLDKISGGVNSKIEPLAHQSDAVFRAFTAQTRNPHVVSALVNQLDSDASAARVGSVVAAAMGDTPRPGSPMLFSSAAKLLDSSSKLNLDVVELENRIEQALPMNPAGSKDSYPRENLKARLKTSRARRALDMDALLDDVRSASSLSALNAAISRFDSAMTKVEVYHARDFELAVLVLANPHVDASHVGRFHHYVGAPRLKSVADRAVSTRNVDVARAACQFALHSSIDLFGTLYAESDEPEQLLEWLADGLDVAPAWLTNSDVVRENRALALRFLPIASVMGVKQYADNVQAALTERLGDSDKAWETFTSLADEWAGTFDALVGASVAFAQES